MAKSDYVNQGHAPFVAQQITFMNGIGSYAGVLGLTPAEIAAQAADAKYAAFSVDWQDVLQKSTSQDLEPDHRFPQFLQALEVSSSSSSKSKIQNQQSSLVNQNAALGLMISD